MLNTLRSKKTLPLSDSSTATKQTTVQKHFFNQERHKNLYHLVKLTIWDRSYKEKTDI